MKFVTAAIATIALCASSVASAAVYAFSYTSGATVLSGVITGTLQGDNNTIFVSAVEDVVLNGFAQAPHLNISTVSSGVYATPTTPMVTLDGSVMELLACQAPIGGCPTGFALDTTATGIAFAGQPAFVFAYAGIGNGNDLYDPQGWSIGSAVPEPASWALLITGFGLTGAALRRRRTLQAA